MTKRLWLNGVGETAGTITFLRHQISRPCQYLHNLRMQGLSDHSAIEVDLRDGDTESAANSSQRLGISIAALSYSLEIPRDNHLNLPSCDMEPVMNMSNQERIRISLRLLTEGLKPFIEKEMCAVYGEGWEQEARSALRTRPDIQLHWDSQAVLSLIDRRWNEVFRGKLEKKHRSWTIEALDLRQDLMHEKKPTFSDKETMRGLDTIECLLIAVGAAESQEVALLKGAISAQKRPQQEGAANSLSSSIAWLSRM